MMKRTHFEVNRNNQLLIKPQGEKEPIAVDGRFSLDKDNGLIYRLNEPAAWRREYGLPNKVKFKGSWGLNSNHDLELYLDKTEEQFRGDGSTSLTTTPERSRRSGRLCLRGKILCAEKENLIFQIKSRDRQGVNRFSFLKFSGIWQADEFNRIIFQVKKKEKPDTLVFKGTWQVNKNQQIIYEYEKTTLKTKRKIRHSLSFSGYWQISSANRLRYILSGSSQSRFDFRVQLESPNLYPKKGAIKYRLGVGIRRDLQPARIRIISLYGTWKFNRRLGLSFKMHYGQGKVRRLVFGAEVNLSQKDKVTFKLIDKQGRRLGISVNFRHCFLSKRDAEWFLRLRQNRREKKIVAGVRIGF